MNGIGPGGSIIRQSFEICVVELGREGYPADEHEVEESEQAGVDHPSDVVVDEPLLYHDVLESGRHHQLRRVAPERPVETGGVGKCRLEGESVVHIVGFDVPYDVGHNPS